MDAYERLLGDAMNGDPTLFAREDAVEAEWRIVAPILTGATAPHEYEVGTLGTSRSRPTDRSLRRLAHAAALTAEVIAVNRHGT